MSCRSDTEPFVQDLLARHGKLFSEESGIGLAQNTPSPLFRWLCAALLMSARISHTAALRAARALSDAGWTTAAHMAGSTWEDRVQVLNRSGYARYDESTARMLGDTAQRLRDEYDGDLRKLRAASDHMPQAERERLKEFKGLGVVGVGIFCREVQMVWPEQFPFLDKKACKGARRFGLPDAPEALSELVARDDFARLATALVRAELEK